MHRHPSPRNRTFRRCGFTLIGVVALVSASVGGPTGPARADDPQRSYEAAQAELSRLGHESEILVDRFDTNAEQLARLERRLDTGRGRLDVLRRQVDAQRVQVRRQAVIAYKFGSDQSVSLLMSLKDPGEFPAASKYLGHVQAGARIALENFKAVRDDLDAEVVKVQTAESEQKRTVEALRSQRSQIEGSISQQEELSARYKIEIDAQQAREQAAAEARLRAAEEAARARPAAVQARPAGPSRGAGTTNRSGNVGEDKSGGAPSPSGGAAAAISTARAQLGKPYRWGAAGPDAFDCSGLTSYAWRAGGVSLPHSSSAQIASVRSVSMSEIQPGDLLWRPGHIALYIGGGTVIHASQTGQPVKYGSAGGFARAGRP